MTMSDTLTVTDADALSELNTDIARDLIGRVPSELTETVTVGPRAEREVMTLYVTESSGAFALYEADTWAEAFQGDVTDVVPEFEAIARQAASRDVSISYNPAHDSRTDFDEVDFGDE